MPKGQQWKVYDAELFADTIDRMVRRHGSEPKLAKSIKSRTRRSITQGYINKLRRAVQTGIGADTVERLLRVATLEEQGDLGRALFSPEALRHYRDRVAWMVKELRSNGFVVDESDVGDYRVSVLNTPRELPDFPSLRISEAIGPTWLEDSPAHLVTVCRDLAPALFEAFFRDVPDSHRMQTPDQYRIVLSQVWAVAPLYQDGPFTEARGRVRAMARAGTLTGYLRRVLKAQGDLLRNEPPINILARRRAGYGED
jgi:hypothetical protein